MSNIGIIASSLGWAQAHLAALMANDSVQIKTASGQSGQRRKPRHNPAGTKLARKAAEGKLGISCRGW